jgi:hypothetical protein
MTSSTAFQFCNSGVSACGANDDEWLTFAMNFSWQEAQCVTERRVELRSEDGETPFNNQLCRKRAAAKTKTAHFFVPRGCIEAHASETELETAQLAYNQHHPSAAAAVCISWNSAHDKPLPSALKSWVKT